MWIEASEDCLPALQSKGWSLTHGNGKTYLVAPDGMRLPVCKPPAACKLYICHARGSTRFKVGISTRPKDRRNDLQTGSAFPLEMIFSADVPSRDVEIRAHDLLVRWHSHGEWFDLKEKAGNFRRVLGHCKTASEVLDLLGRLEENVLAFSSPN